MCVHHIRAASFAILLLLAQWPGTSARALPYRTIATSGQAAPGTEANTAFAAFANSQYSFSTAVINQSGEVAFRGFLAGDNVFSGNNTGIWSEMNGNLNLVAREGMSTPNGSIDDVSIFTPAIGDGGQISFSTNAAAIWSAESGVLRSVAKGGLPAPGTNAGVQFSGFNSSSMNRHTINEIGQNAFSGSLSGVGVNGSNNRGIWAERMGSLTLVARAGTAAPGTASGTNFAGTIANQVYSFDDPILNDSGQIAFIAGVTGSGVNIANNRGIWSEAGGVLHLVTRSGASAPGTEVGVNFAGQVNQQTFGFESLGFNDFGQIVFRAQLTGPGTNPSNDFGIWSEGGGSLHLVVRSGSGAPGFIAEFGRVFLPLIDNLGQTAFFSELVGDGVSDANDDSIWVERAGGLNIVARAGEHAPGTIEGVAFNGTNFSFGSLAMNGNAQIAFLGGLTGPEVSGSNDFGIWAEGSNGLELVIREGDSIELGQGDVRTVSNLYFVGGTSAEAGRRSSFNERGELVFTAIFTDGGSGVFVANVGVVPEPTFAAIAVAFGIPLSMRRPRNAAKLRD